MHRSRSCSSAPRGPLAAALLLGAIALPSSARAALDDEDEDAAPAAAIVYVDDNGRSCPLVRFDPTAKGDDRQRELGSFPGPCRGARLAFGPERRAVVWFDPATVDRKPRLPGMKAPRWDEESARGARPGQKPKLRLYELAGRRIRALPEPPDTLGEVQDVGYVEQTICALLVEDPGAQTTRTEGEQLYVKNGDGFIPVAEGAGKPTLAHTACLDGGGWARRETVGTRQRDDGGADLQHLEAWDDLEKERSSVRLAPSPRGTVIDEKPALGRLRALTPKGAKPDASWIEVDGTTARLALFRLSNEGPAVGKLAVLDAKGGAAALPNLGFGEGDTVAVQGNGPWVLVASPTTGTHPRLYDARRKRLLFQSDKARAAMFAPTE